MSTSPEETDEEWFARLRADADRAQLAHWRQRLVDLIAQRYTMVPAQPTQAPLTFTGLTVPSWVEVLGSDGIIHRYSSNGMICHEIVLPRSNP